MVKIKFTSNNDDLSTNEGFQFEFKCERCRIGYRTSFQPISSVLDTASSLFGGLFSHASTISDRARSATWEKCYEQAFINAAAEVKDDFVQCPHCSSWVCREKCWNPSKGLCKMCSPPGRREDSSPVESDGGRDLGAFSNGGRCQSDVRGRELAGSHKGNLPGMRRCIGRENQRITVIDQFKGCGSYGRGLLLPQPAIDAKLVDGQKPNCTEGICDFHEHH